MTVIEEVASVEDLPEGTAKVVEVAGRRICLCNYAGTIYAIDDVCTHDGGALDQGELVGKEIECPRHGARFDVTTGRVTRLPAARAVKTYRAIINDGKIALEVPS